jgi:hypothetical protein
MIRSYRRSVALLVLALGLGISSCTETTAPLPPPEELLLVVNAGDNDLSIIPLAREFATVRVPLGGDVPVDARVIAGRRFAVVTTGGGDSLAVVDLTKRSVDRMVSLGEGSGAQGAAIQGDSVAFVALSALGSIARVHLITGAVTTVATGPRPRDLVLTRGRLFVVHGGEECVVPEEECPTDGSWILVTDPVSLVRPGVGDSVPLPGPGNASFAVVASDGRLYVLSTGTLETPAGRLSIVDPVSRVEVGSFGGLGEFPGPITADRGERIIISSITEGLMEFNTRTRSVVRGANAGIPVATNRGVTTDSQGIIYGIEGGTCSGSSNGRVRLFRTDFTEVRSIPLGVCAGSATTTLIPPAEEALRH